MSISYSSWDYIDAAIVESGCGEIYFNILVQKNLMENISNSLCSMWSWKPTTLIRCKLKVRTYMKNMNVQHKQCTSSSICFVPLPRHPASTTSKSHTTPHSTCSVADHQTPLSRFSELLPSRSCIVPHAASHIRTSSKLHGTPTLHLKKRWPQSSSNLLRGQTVYQSWPCFFPGCFEPVG